MANRITHLYSHTTTTTTPSLHTFNSTESLPSKDTKIATEMRTHSQDHWKKTYTARSRWRRRRREPNILTNNTQTTTATTAAAASTIITNTTDLQADSASYYPLNTAYTFFQNSFNACCNNTSTLATCLALMLLPTTCSSNIALPCDTHSWWDPLKDKCIPCTTCEGKMIPLRPCQMHRDTICGSIYDLKIDWVVLSKTEPNWRDRRKLNEWDSNLEEHFTHEELQQLHEEAIPLDWTTAALFIALLACLLFFIVAACILVHHMRQWRRMEKRLDQDVEELSTKLMAKLAEVQSLEGGTFFIGNADALGVPATFQPQHVLLPEKPAKHHDRRILKTLQPGNVYIEENGSKG